eukprot:GHVR01163782.1.p1 GENE.GHVR01163782.1~~GHVR01163782.1.p1  ORF type:complete len:239 (-),score=30.20 GHVR01163782.1:267-893(-)
MLARNALQLAENALQDDLELSKNELTKVTPPIGQVRKQLAERLIEGASVKSFEDPNDQIYCLYWELPVFPPLTRLNFEDAGWKKTALERLVAVAENLQKEGYHHNDVRPQNVRGRVEDEDIPVLIDWDFASNVYSFLVEKNKEIKMKEFVRCSLGELGDEQWINDTWKTWAKSVQTKLTLKETQNDVLETLKLELETEQLNMCNNVTM